MEKTTVQLDSEAQHTEASVAPFESSSVEIDDNSIEQSSKQAAASNGTDTIPNGGLQAWLQVLGAFFLWFNAW